MTTLELFFDLVFVYALTQVTALMADRGDLTGLAQGGALLMVLWWCWCCYAWLGTTVRADAGTTRLTMLGAMAVMFAIALTIPEAFDDLPGGLHAPLLFAGGFLAVRTLHIVSYAIAGRGDPALLGVLARVSVTMLAAAAILAAAAFTDGALQLGLWGVALATDYLGTFLNGNRGWRITSPVHFAERHGLIVIVALGESIVAIGIGISGQPMSWLVTITAMSGLAIAASLWWVYFSVADSAEHRLSATTGDARTAFARDCYTFLHLPMVAGIVLLALGLKKALTYVADATGHSATEPLHGVAMWSLTCGVALFLLARAAFVRRSLGSWNSVQIAVSVALVALTPLLERLPAAAAVGAVAVCCVGLVATTRAHRSTEGSLGKTANE